MISNAYRSLLHGGRLISERLYLCTSSGWSPAHHLCPGAIDSTWRKGYLGLTHIAPERGPAYPSGQPSQSSWDAKALCTPTLEGRIDERVPMLETILSRTDLSRLLQPCFSWGRLSSEERQNPPQPGRHHQFLWGIFAVQLVFFTREGNGNPLQYSCLGNPRDGGAW